MAEHNQQFDSFVQWVNKASSWLTRRGDHVKACCYDSRGRYCATGKEFMRARDEDAFPIYWVWPGETIKIPALTTPTEPLVD